MGDHSVKAKDIWIGENKDKILIVLYTSKTHGEESYPQEIKISAQNKFLHKKKRNFCPFKIVLQFMQLRGSFSANCDNLFICRDGLLLTPAQARETLSTALKSVNINASLYSFHSLRSGRSCDLLKYGYTVDQIKDCGRWKSNAVYRYLR